ncbi:lysoplasmalogenase family protein [Cribrihabitans neustonicus]|uniref:lysoplasmalogenase family protein n=1 Tax=Cribrihabitans neustonicus TaxID=1429085 RepID=UPI003B5B4F36
MEVSADPRMLWGGAAALAFWYLLLAARPPGFWRSAAKTGAVLLLALGAWASGAPAPLISALGLCALGDLFLSRDGEGAFLAGVAAFAAGHLTYAALFLTRDASMPARILELPGLAAAAAMVLAGLGMAVLLAPRAGPLKGAVLGYVPVILAMGFAALTLPGAFGAAVFAAACAFMLSDIVLAFETFVLPPAHPLRRVTPFAVWVLYWGAQAGFTALFS